MGIADQKSREDSEATKSADNLVHVILFVVSEYCPGDRADEIESGHPPTNWAPLNSLSVIVSGYRVVQKRRDAKDHTRKDRSTAERGESLSNCDG